MLDATFARPDLTTFCRLDELGLEVLGQRLEPDRAGSVVPALRLRLQRTPRGDTPERRGIDVVMQQNGSGPLAAGRVLAQTDAATRVQTEASYVTRKRSF